MRGVVDPGRRYAAGAASLCLGRTCCFLTFVGLKVGDDRFLTVAALIEAALIEAALIDAALYPIAREKSGLSIVRQIGAYTIKLFDCRMWILVTPMVT